MTFTVTARITDPCCIYGLVSDGNTYLADALFPGARRIPLAEGQDAEVILDQIGPEVRWFVWHVFLTYKSAFPRDRAVLTRQLRKRGIISINEGVTDGSKRHIQAILADLGLPTTIAPRDGDPEELLFMKSNFNFGGIAERRLPQSLRDFFDVALPHPSAPLFKDYRVVRRRYLRPEAFDIDDIFVERFVANEMDVFYRAFVAFDAVVLSKLVCKSVIKKALNSECRQDYFLSFSDSQTGFSSAPDDTSRRIMTDLQRFCRAFKLDIGALDVLLNDKGTPYIIDANPTSYGGANCDQPGLMEHLSKGVQAQAAAASTGAD